MRRRTISNLLVYVYYFCLPQTGILPKKEEMPISVTIAKTVITFIFSPSSDIAVFAAFSVLLTGKAHNIVYLFIRDANREDSGQLCSISQQ